MPDNRDDFEAALKQLAEEVRRGIAKTQPLTAEQEKAIKEAVELQEQEKQRGTEQNRESDHEMDHDQDIEM